MLNLCSLLVPSVWQPCLCCRCRAHNQTLLQVESIRREAVYGYGPLHSSTSWVDLHDALIKVCVRACEHA